MRTKRPLTWAADEHEGLALVLLRQLEQRRAEVFADWGTRDSAHLYRECNSQLTVTDAEDHDKRDGMDAGEQRHLAFKLYP